MAEDEKMMIDGSFPIPFTFLKGAMAQTEGRAMTVAMMFETYTEISSI